MQCNAERGLCATGVQISFTASDRPRKLDVLCVHQQDTTGTRCTPHRIFITKYDT